MLFEGVECRCADCKKTQGIRECDMDRNMVCEGCLDFVCADCQKKRAAASGIRNSWDVYGYDLIDYWCTDCHVGRCASCSEGDDLFYKTIKNRCKECRRNYIDARKEKRRRARERGEEYADLKPFRGYHIKVDHVRHIDDGSIDAIEGGDWVPKKRKPTRVLGKRSVKKARRGEKD